MVKSFFENIPRYFFVLFVVFFAATFFTFYESFRMYRAEAEILVISKGATVRAERVAATIAHLPSTLSFYDRLLVDHENITDPWEGEASIDRKSAWNGVIESFAIPGADVIRVAVSSADSSQAGALLNASIETLYGFSGRLYNRDTQADMRLIDGVIVYPVLVHAWALFSISALFSAVFAFLFSLLFQTSLASAGRISFLISPSLRVKAFARGSEPLRPVGAFPDISEPMSEPEGRKDESLAVSESEEATDILKKEEEREAKQEAEQTEPKKEEGIEPHDIWEKPRPVVTERPRVRLAIPQGNSVQTHTPAPRNLSTVLARDFTWEGVLFQNDETKEEAKEEERVDEGNTSSPPEEPLLPLPEKREPTPEELKVRLNQLLRGEL